ncbi:MAG: hypothetical protein PHQ85_09305, partial [Eubacteriales bacterium]|nr:hypothetical protein [Eubacteriales bacterium]MDD4710507.1 hypothetical protein [Eubacteriales bacterium]
TKDSFPFHVFFHPPPRGRVNLPVPGTSTSSKPEFYLQQLYTNGRQMVESQYHFSRFANFCRANAREGVGAPKGQP